MTIEQQIIDLIRRYESQKSNDNPSDVYSAGFYDGRDQERQSVIEDLKEIVGIE